MMSPSGRCPPAVGCARQPWCRHICVALVRLQVCLLQGRLFAQAAFLSVIIIIISRTFLSQEASGTCDASQLPPDRLVSSIMGVVFSLNLCTSDKTTSFHTVSVCDGFKRLFMHASTELLGQCVY